MQPSLTTFPFIILHQHIIACMEEVFMCYLSWTCCTFHISFFDVIFSNIQGDWGIRYQGLGEATDAINRNLCRKEKEDNTLPNGDGTNSRIRRSNEFSVISNAVVQPLYPHQLLYICMRSRTFFFLCVKCNRCYFRIFDWSASQSLHYGASIVLFVLMTSTTTYKRIFCCRS